MSGSECGEDAAAAVVAVEALWSSWLSVTSEYTNQVIRSRDGRRPVGAKGINRRVGEWIFDRDVINLYRGSESLEIDRITQETGVIPYDIPGVELSYDGELYSFNTILRKYALTDSSLLDLATLCGVPTQTAGYRPTERGAAGYFAGLSRNFQDDYACLAQGMVIDDTLHVWCQYARGERHNWEY